MRKLKFRLKRGIGKLSMCINRINTKKKVKKLENADDAVINLVAEVLYKTIGRKSNSEEKKFIHKIEKLREELNNSQAEISVTDYGAGSPNDSFKEEAMYQGKKKKIITGMFCKSASKSYKWCFLLFNLIRKFRPSVCLELGTACGISSAYQAAALELNNHGKIITIEGSKSLALLAKNNFEKLNFERVEVITGRFQDNMEDVLNNNKLLDFVFIDGHHDKKATLNYFRQIIPNLNNNAIIIFDDISWSSGMKEAWKIVKVNKNLKVIIDLYKIGICIFSKQPVEKTRYYKISI